MKRLMFLLSSAALLLAGCAKEETAPAGGAGEEVTVTVEAGVPTADTKAVSDNDGNAVKANHWIMEVRDKQGNLFYRDVKTPAEGTLKQKFTVTLIRNQSYTFLFWADNNGGYYNTADLTNVTLEDESGYSANLDARDAFTASQAYKSITSDVINVELYRPFAQINIITTDLAKLWDQVQSTPSPAETYLKFEPKDYIAKVKVPTSFNVMTQECGQISAQDVVITASETYTGYKDDSTTVQLNNNYQLHTNPATLFMDYLFAPKGQKNLVDIQFEFTSNEETIGYTFTAIPVQANYRTNIKGQILSNDTEWNVEIVPAWNTPESDVEVFTTTINNIEKLNDALQSNEAKSAKEVIADITMPTDSDDKDVTFTSSNNDQTVTLNFSGDLGTSKTLTFKNDGASGTEGPANLSITAPSGTSLVFDNPFTHVVINGTQYELITGTVSASSLIVKDSVTVHKLIMKQGGLEIHGTVEEIEIETPKTVTVRTCEGLSQEVYDILKRSIAIGYKGVQNGNTWNIVPDENHWLNSAAESFEGISGTTITINSAEQLALLAKNVLEGNTYSGWTVNLGADIDLGGKEWLPVGIKAYRTVSDDDNTRITPEKPFSGTFDGKDHTVSNLTISVPDKGLAYNGAGLFGYMKEGGTIKNVNIKNPNIDGRLYVGAVIGYPYTGTSIKNCHVSGDIDISASWYCGGIAGYGYISTIKECSVVGDEGSTIKGNAGKYNDGTAGYFGGIIGFRGENAQVIDNCTVANVTITAECNGLGGITGILHHGNTVKNCALSNVTLTMNTKDTNEVKRLGLFAGGNNGTAAEPGWCINNDAEGCTVTSLAGICTSLVGKNGTGMPNPTCVIGNGVQFDADGKVMAGTFYAIPATVVAEGYEIVKNADDPTLYDVVPYKAPFNIGEAGYDTLSEALSAVKDGDTISIVKAGEYKVQTLSTDKSITIEAAVDGVVFTRDAGGWVSNCSKKVTVKNLKWVVGSADYQYFKNIELDGCTLDGLVLCHTYNRFINTTFTNRSGYCLWTYGVASVDFSGCEFNTYNGKAVNVYCESTDNTPCVYTFTDCDFKNLSHNVDDDQNDICKPGLAIKNNGNGTQATKPSYYDIQLTSCTFDGFGQSDGDLFGFPTDEPYVNAYGYNSETDPLKITVDGTVRVNIQKAE